MIDNPTAIEEIAVEIERPSYQALKKRVLLAMILCSGFTGFILGILPEDSIWVNRFADFFGIAILLLIIMWFEYDARQHFYRISLSLRVSLILIFPIAFLYYLFRVRGLSAFKTILIMPLYLGMLLFLMVTAAVLSSIIVWLVT